MAHSMVKRFLQALLGSLVMLAGAAWAVTTAAVFATPEAASDALVTALKASDRQELRRVLGDDWRTYIPTEGMQREDVEAFLARYDEGHRVQAQGGKAHLVVGEQPWVLPIPLVHGSAGWSFDARGAHQEILARQIGDNELSVQQALLAYYDAQREYASQVHDGAAVAQYAQRFLSTPGKHDGLFWESRSESDKSPLGRYFASAPSGGAYFGYRYRILTAQGPSAPGGAYTYLSGPNMTDGFALVAWPARYGETGVMTFEISHEGQIFQKDLGSSTEQAASSIDRFDPDSSWAEAKLTQ